MWETLTRHAAFRRLWIAATVDAFGSWLLVMAVPLHVHAVTGSATTTGLALAVQGLPAMVAGPWAGAAADRYSRRTVLVVANLACAAGVALMLTATAPGRIWLLYAGLIVESTAMCLLRPAFQAATPTLLPGESALASANALLALSHSVLRIAGPLAGTYLTAIGWFPAVVMADLASYLVAAAIIGTLPIRNSPATNNKTINEGVRHIARTPMLRGLLISGWLYWTANAGLTALLVPFVTQQLRAGGRTLGNLVTGLGIGFLIGAAVSRRLLLRRDPGVVVALAYTAVGLGFLVMFTTTSVVVAVATATATGVPGAIAMIVTGQQVQVRTPDEVRGRVAAAFQTSDAVAAVAGALAASALVAVIALDHVLTGFSAMVLVAAIVLRIVLRRGATKPVSCAP